MWGGEGGLSEPPEPPRIRHCTRTWTLAITMTFWYFLCDKAYE